MITLVEELTLEWEMPFDEAEVDDSPTHICGEANIEPALQGRINVSSALLGRIELNRCCDG